MAHTQSSLDPQGMRSDDNLRPNFKINDAFLPECLHIPLGYLTQ